MFLFFYTICLAIDTQICLAEELGMTKKQAKYIVESDYDFRMLPGFIAAFSNELASKKITSPEVYIFMGEVFSLLIACSRKDLDKISKEEMDPSHPLAAFYDELKAKAMEKINQEKSSRPDQNFRFPTQETIII